MTEQQTFIADAQPPAETTEIGRYTKTDDDWFRDFQQRRKLKPKRGHGWQQAKAQRDHAFWLANPRYAPVSKRAYYEALAGQQEAKAA